MKTLALAIPLVLLAACNRDNRNQTPGEVAGKTAYTVEKNVKKAAKEAAKDLKTFSQDAHEGFQEAKQKDVARKKEEK